MKGKKLGFFSLVLVCSLALALAAAFVTTAGFAKPMQAPSRIVLPGLEKPATVLIDQWGVPHIYANAFYDAFCVQGFMAARDRLWQIDLWRKRGLGEMAKDFGPAYVEGDRMARAVLFRGDMYREWLAYGSDAKRVAEAFVAGVNAYVAQTEAKPELLPEEFRLLGYKSARWQAEDVVRIRHHGLTLNFTGEIARAELYCKFKSEAMRADWLRRELVPSIEPKLPEGLDPCNIPAAELKRAYSLATAVPRFPKEGWQTLKAATLPVEELYDVLNNNEDTVRNFGSNNWVIAGKKSTTGRPILANDPHRAHGAPSLRYISHLTAPGLSVIGAGEPFLPGISIGHNGVIGFGLTRFYMDQEDLYVYETNPMQASEYKYRDRWEPMTTISEEIAVKGETSPRKVTLTFTRHGPVLYTDATGNRAWALRAAWLDVGMAPYFGSMDYMRAQNWDQFRAAMNRWGAPGENQVYADKSGNIGWMPGGLTPIRPNWDGLMPVPGDGRYEWAGYRNMDELPFAYNPGAGYVVTANENTIPSDHPAAQKGVGYEWSDTARSMRLKQLFNSRSRYSFADSLAWQNDTTSTHAQRLVALLKGLSAADAETSEALDLLRAWNGNSQSASAAAALYEVWFSKYLRPAAVRAALSPEAAKVVGDGDATRVILLLEEHEAWMKEKRADVLMNSLKSAVAEVRAKLGPDMKNWQWGRLHKAVFVHPLNDILDDGLRQRFNVNADAIGGSPFTPMNTTYRNSDFQLMAGASFRMVLDIGNWDASRVVNAPGQSGNPANPHYRDLAPLWAKGDYFPLVYTRAAVEKASRQKIELMPQ